MMLMSNPDSNKTSCSGGGPRIWFRTCPVKLSRLNPLRVLTLCFLGVVLLLVPFTLSAQIQFPLDSPVSVCVDPPDQSFMVRSDTEKQNFKDCRRWSDYTPTYRFIEASNFENCNPNIPAVNQFARYLLKVWDRDPGNAPSAQSIYDNPSDYGLTRVGEKEARSRSMAVWRGSATAKGMVAFVQEDRASGEEQRSNLELLRVIYPSFAKCGVLIPENAKKLDAWLAAGSPRFLRPKDPKFFWNHWLQPKKTSGRVDFVTVNQEYRYVVDLSPFQYPRVVNGDEATGFKFPNPSSFDITIRFYPIGGFFNYSDIKVINTRVESSRIGEVLSTSLAGIGSFSDASKKLGLLQTISDGGTLSSDYGVSYDFSVSKPGCFQIVVLAMEQSTRKVVGAWIKSFTAYPEDTDPSSRVELPGCSDKTGSALLYKTVSPRYPGPSEENLKAIVTYLDIGEHTFGFLEDLRYSPATLYVWKLQISRLKEELSLLADKIDDLIEKSTFRLVEASEPLTSFLFSCDRFGRDDEECHGGQALKALEEIAFENTSPKVTIEVFFRDLENNAYFIPFHLVSVRNELLGSKVRITQPLPLPPAPCKPDICVKDWHAGLILKDDDEIITPNWQKDWISRILDKKGDLDLVPLRDQYFGVVRSGESPTPEGLVILAHHKGGTIQETQKTRSLQYIRPDHIQRNFGTPSVAILVTCSVGAPGSAPRENNELINRLNKNNVQAIIASPFKVPATLAQRFMEHLGIKLKENDNKKTVYELFSSVKERMKGVPRSATSPDTDHVKSIVDSFMLLGSGDVDICKFGDKKEVGK